MERNLLDRTLYLVTPAALLRIFMLESDREYFARPVRVLPVPYTGDQPYVHDPRRGHTYPVDPRNLVPAYALTRRQREAIAELERFGLLCLESWAGRSEQRVAIVGETSRRFRIRAITSTRLAGRRRELAPGQIALVPKAAVRAV